MSPEKLQNSESYSLERDTLANAAVGYTRNRPTKSVTAAHEAGQALTIAIPEAVTHS